MSLVAATQLRWPPVHPMLSHRESAMMAEAQWSGLDGNTDVICGVHLQMCEWGPCFFHTIKICTSYVRNSTYWREEKANEITVHNWVCITRCVLNGVNYGGLMMFDSCHFVQNIRCCYPWFAWIPFNLAFIWPLGEVPWSGVFWGNRDATKINQTGGWSLGWWFMFFWWYFPIEWEVQTSNIPQEWRSNDRINTGRFLLH